SYVSRKTMLTPKKIVTAISTVGTMVSQTTALILPFCFILAGFVFTGLSSQLTSGLVTLAGGNVIMILVLGVLACYILGTLGMDLVAYIFLAVSMAPAAIKAGELNVLAVHLFIVYYAMLAAITPPVAIAAWVGGAMAGADIMKTGWTAMRLGAVIFFVPIFFIYHPALILQGAPLQIIWFIFAAYSGTFIIALGLEGYFYGIGKMEVWTRPLLIISGLAIGWGEMPSFLTGLAIAAVTILVSLRHRLSRRKVATV
ncbi:MAG: TRAP transporter large permease subunit, partial [Dehalococcoidia bacterium]|nr:TRAP transporter large permease subunit [Dehalococcoidia bacterium]